MNKLNNLAILILAAGTSSRLGEPKQLLKYKNESLLKIAVKKALEISSNIFVVLGHEKEKCEEEIRDFDITIIYNKNYKEGMGTSLSCGINQTKTFDNTLIMLCDQPFIPISHYKNLIKNIQDETIIASIYDETTNSKVPAIFPRKYYDKLISLNADLGAREILKKENCINIELDKNLSIDIDTIEDKNSFLK